MKQSLISTTPRQMRRLGVISSPPLKGQCKGQSAGGDRTSDALSVDEVVGAVLVSHHLYRSL